MNIQQKKYLVERIEKVERNKIAEFKSKYEIKTLPEESSIAEYGKINKANLVKKVIDEIKQHNFYMYDNNRTASINIKIPFDALLTNYETVKKIMKEKNNESDVKSMKILKAIQDFKDTIAKIKDKIILENSDEAYKELEKLNNITLTL